MLLYDLHLYIDVTKILNIIFLGLLKSKTHFQLGHFVISVGYVLIKHQ